MEPMPDPDDFAFDFNARFKVGLAVIGVTPRRARVTLAEDRLIARFGPWVCETPYANVADTCRTGPYRWYTALGPRLSMVDRGLTFGTTPAGGVCVLFHEPVTGLDPLGKLQHPGLTVTVADGERFHRTLRARAGLD
jgi:hypothetical protein